MTIVLLFASTFFLVFFLGLQSLVVNAGYRVIAFCNSFLIGACNLALFKLAPEANGMEIAAYLTGGPLGIVTSMIVFNWYRRTRNKVQP